MASISGLPSDGITASDIPASPVFLQTDPADVDFLASHLTAVCDNLPLQPPVSAPMQPTADSQPSMLNDQQPARYTWDYDDYAASKLVCHERLKEPLEMVYIQQELTRANYKKKFDNLLCWEEMARIHVLDGRLVHAYSFDFHQYDDYLPYSHFSAMGTTRSYCTKLV